MGNRLRKLKALRGKRSFPMGKQLLQKGYWRLTLKHGQVTKTIPEQATLSPNHHSTPMGRRLNLDRFYMQQHPIHGSSAVQVGTHDTPASSPLP
ncbi:hypothetical protein TNCV_1587371 [Trichonephila clavipes]|uniref:Uncharacterized protein n=1 Tax=Trichonephila clavipes TaxID=2585209 RepID=A0A8X6RJ68_TRICX|nr:hypothetical protein TNCV_1587371 [Trichonephila clavipes]